MAAKGICHASPRGLINCKRFSSSASAQLQVKKADRLLEICRQLHRTQTQASGCTFKAPHPHQATHVVKLNPTQTYMCGSRSQQSKTALLSSTTALNILHEARDLKKRLLHDTILSGDSNASSRTLFLKSELGVQAGSDNRSGWEGVGGWGQRPGRRREGELMEEWGVPYKQPNVLECTELHRLTLQCTVAEGIVIERWGKGNHVGNSDRFGRGRSEFVHSVPRTPHPPSVRDRSRVAEDRVDRAKAFHVTTRGLLLLPGQFGSLLSLESKTIRRRIT